MGRLLSCQGQISILRAKASFLTIWRVRAGPRASGRGSSLNKRRVCEEHHSSLVLAQQTLSSAWKMQAFNAPRKEPDKDTHCSVALSLKLSVSQMQLCSSPLGMRTLVSGFETELKP